jgi:mono/diheme cytochrome c family protein
MNGCQRTVVLALSVGFVASLATQTDAAASRAEGLAAWQQVYTVLTHPRCVNCHTATSHPEQGDENEGQDTFCAMKFNQRSHPKLCCYA